MRLFAVFFPMAVSQTGMCDPILVQISHQHFPTTSTTCPEVEGAANCFWLQTMQAEAFLVKSLLSYSSLLLFSKPVILTLIFSINLIVNWQLNFFFFPLGHIILFTYTVWCHSCKIRLNIYISVNLTFYREDCNEYRESNRNETWTLSHQSTQKKIFLHTHTHTKQEQVCEFTFATRTVSDASEKAFVSTWVAYCACQKQKAFC